MRLLLSALFIAMLIFLPAGVSTYAQQVADGTPTKTIGFFDQLRFWITDRLEENGVLNRSETGESEKQTILDDLKSGFSVAQERIDRVRERLGDQAVDGIVDANELNKLHEEFLEIRAIEDPEQRRIQAQAFETEVNRMTLVKQGCERPIDVTVLVETEDYYEKLRTDYCSRTLGDIDKETAFDILQRNGDGEFVQIQIGEACPDGFHTLTDQSCVRKTTVDIAVCSEGQTNVFGKCIGDDNPMFGQYFEDQS